MSRYEIEGRKPGTKVAVGWDPPMQTYFVQVYDSASDEEGPTVWLGGMLRELYELEVLERAIRPHAELPLELRSALCLDRDEDR